MPLEHRLTDAELADAKACDILVLCKCDAKGLVIRHFARIVTAHPGSIFLMYTDRFEREITSRGEPVFTWRMATRGLMHAAMKNRPTFLGYGQGSIDDKTIWLEGFEPWEKDASGVALMTMFPYAERASLSKGTT